MSKIKVISNGYEVVDRSAEVRVGNSMALRGTTKVSKFTALAAMLLSVGLAACGGKNKKEIGRAHV